MILVHIDRKALEAGEDAVVERVDGDLPEWSRCVIIHCASCGTMVGRVRQDDTQDEYGAAVRVELE